jgi:hypothetical protein
VSAVEVRCPVNSQGMMFKLLGTADAGIMPGNTIQITCGGCREAARRAGREVTAVLHEFNLLGELVHTEEILPGV